ncbi:acyl-CoA dehydrogenase family protein [Novosphingobium sp. TH158]|uniref:acyl-CoA dehydrogenase family protein n=1 Tax=Novosphingobium sp. TH158 TaxID=2067455 RepID=UPI000C7DD463|nr:acyl-CoA dehydrogenase family protein [Novosphingobium sp. TH158]PLK26287.1 acyl-CoA dehydrogenase [Novosphingobium sp. TH158]
MIELSELRDSAAKAFPAGSILPNREESWQLASEMGWLLVDLPEDLGGLGLGRAAGAAIIQELGKVLCTAPLVPALLALRGIAGAPDFDGKAQLVERICGGEYVPLNMLPGSVRAAPDGSLSGLVPGLFEADMASTVLVGSDDGYRLIPLDAEGVTLVERPLWDESRRIFDLVLAGVPASAATLVADGEAAAALHDEIARSAMLYVAADSLGGAAATFDLTVEYLKMRKQFDRPLAMFQALKHRCADLKIALTVAEALFETRAAAADTASVVELGAMKGHATDTFRLIVEDAIQLHGGIGLTQEYPVHHYMKRAMLNLQLCGSLDRLQEVTGRAALAAYA